MAEDIDVVFRDWNVPGIPGSGEYEPEKPRIRNLLKQIEASGGQSVTRNTLAELNAVTPPTENYGGIVLNDPDAANNGYYAREAGTWVRGRGFPDTFAEGILSGPASAQIASFSPGVNPADIEVFWSKVSTVNAGPMTLNGKEVLSVAGAPLIANEWSGVVLYVDEGANWRLLIDVNAAQIASQSASSAAGSAVAANNAADRAEAAASGVEFPVSYAPQTLTPEQQAQARDNISVGQYNTIADVEAATVNATIMAIRVGGYYAAGDGGGAAYARADSEPSHPGKVRSGDGAWWVLAETSAVLEMFGAVGDGVTDDHAAVAKAFEFARLTGQTLIIPGKSYGLSDKIVMSASAVVDASRRAEFVAVSGATDAIEIRPGNADGETRLPQFRGFSGVALTVKCNISRIKVPKVSECGTAVLYSATEGNILDTIVEVEFIAACDRAVEFLGNSASRVVQGCGVNYNFITNTSDIVAFEGQFNTVDGLWLRGAAIDLTAAQADGVVLQNNANIAVTRFSLGCSSWLGGDGFTTSPYAKFIAGAGSFTQADFDIVNATTLSQRNMTSGRIGGISFVRTRKAVSRAPTWTVGIENYNGGVADDATTLILSVNTVSSWPSGSVKDLFFYDIWTENSQQTWQVTPLNLSTGIVVQQVINENATEALRTRIRLANLSGSTIANPAPVHLLVRRN